MITYWWAWKFSDFIPDFNLQIISRARAATRLSVNRLVSGLYGFVELTGWVFFIFKTVAQPTGYIFGQPVANRLTW
jgi:hypothetical protein